MLSKYRSLAVYTAVAVVIGGGCAFIAMLTAGTLRPPWWWTAGFALIAGLIADQIERWDARRQERRARARSLGARPTDTDGTPYSYRQIVDAGWAFCEGCRQWGQGWTPDTPHDCPQTYIHGPVTNRKASR